MIFILIIISLCTVPGTISGLIYKSVAKGLAVGISLILTPVLIVMVLWEIGPVFGYSGGEASIVWGFGSVLYGLPIGYIIGIVGSILCLRLKRFNNNDDIV